jgi:hypothetical protein
MGKRAMLARMADRPKPDLFERTMPQTAGLKPIDSAIKYRSEREMLIALIDKTNEDSIALRELGERVSDLQAHFLVADAQRANDKEDLDVQRAHDREELEEWQTKIELRMKETRNEVRRIAAKTVGGSELENTGVTDLRAVAEAEKRRGKRVRTSFWSFTQRRVWSRVIDIGITFLLMATGVGLVHVIGKMLNKP